MRNEKTHVRLYIPAGTPKRYRKMIEDMSDLHTKIGKNDSGNVYYSIDIDYYGNVEKNLKNVIKLAKSGYVVELDLEVLNHKVCLIKEFIDELREYE